MHSCSSNAEAKEDPLKKCQLHVGTTAPMKIPREEVGSRWRLLTVKTTSRYVEKAAAITLTAANTVADNSTALTTSLLCRHHNYDYK